VLRLCGQTAQDNALVRLRALTLNLHCWQESDALEKLYTVARAIAKEGIDVVMFQEAAQHKDALVASIHHGVEIKSDNAVAIVAQHLLSEFNLTYEFAWDYSHLGWEVWEEGIAVLTRGTIKNVESHWVSTSQSTSDWLSRKMLIADIEIDNQQFRVASTHLGWWNYEREPFDQQFTRVQSLTFANMQSTLLAGDFNVAASTPGYHYMMNDSNLVDCYLECHPHDLLQPTIGGRIDGWEVGDADGQRIDYMLVDRRGNLQPMDARIIFADGDYGLVSDHFGVLVDFETTNPTNPKEWPHD
jgi:maltose 6'-phosphate phosphatase